MKRIFKVGVLVLGIVLAAGCGGGSGGAESPATPFSVAVNKHDPLFFSAKAEGGQTVEYYGSRDEVGRAVTLDTIVVKDAAGSPTAYNLDSLGRPTLVTAANGVSMQFNWTGDKQAVLSVTSPDGATQVNTYIDFAGPMPTAAMARTVRLPRQGAARLTFKSGEGHRSLSSTALPRTRQVASSDVLVSVSRCEMPDPGPLQVYVDARPSGGGPWVRLPAIQTGAGTYSATIPAGTATVTNLSEVCDSIEAVAGLGCSALELLGPQATVYILSALAVAIDVFTIPSGEAAIMIAAAEKAVAGMELYCATLGASPQPGAPSLAEFLCKSPQLNRSIVGDLDLQALVNALPAPVKSGLATVPGEGPYGTLAIDMGGTTTVRSLTLDPPNPGQFQSYVGTADVFCVPAGSTVTMSIVGTDGYQDSEVYPIVDTELNGQFSLSVPGAESGVQDTVTLKIDLPEGGSVVRTAYLVFG